MQLRFPLWRAILGLLVIVVFASGPDRAGPRRPATDAAPDPRPRGPYVVAQLQRVDDSSDTSVGVGQLIRRIDELGFTGTRLGFEWSEMEPEPGDYRWGEMDAVISLLRLRGLEAFGLLTYSPAWARPAGEDRTHRPVVDGSAARGDTAFAAFAAAAARRYRSFVDHWEIWNEPNIVRYHYWHHVKGSVEYGPDPADYVALYELARDSILAANPAARVATGGLATGPREGPIESNDPDVRWKWGYPADVFLESMLDAGLEPTDVALHPYPYDPDTSVSGALARSRAVLDRRGHADARIWITEWGIDRDLPGLGSEQADRLTIEALSRFATDPRIDLFTVFALTGVGPRNYELVDHEGDLTAAGRSVRAWIAARAAAASYGRR